MDEICLLQKSKCLSCFDLHYKVERRRSGLNIKKKCEIKLKTFIIFGGHPVHFVCLITSVGSSMPSNFIIQDIDLKGEEVSLRQIISFIILFIIQTSPLPRLISDKLFKKLSDFLRDKKLPLTLPVFSFLHLKEDFQPEVLSMCFWLSQNKYNVVYFPPISDLN